MTGAPAHKLMRLSVEYGLTEHRNISCHACAHASPLLTKRFAKVVDFIRDFGTLAEMFHSRDLRIVGGEPLLHPELLKFLRARRRIGIAHAIVVCTNGVLLHGMPDESWRLINNLRSRLYHSVRRRIGDEDYAETCRPRLVSRGSSGQGVTHRQLDSTAFWAWVGHLLRASAAAWPARGSATPAVIARLQ